MADMEDWEGWNNKWRPSGSGTTSHSRRLRVQQAAQERDRLAAQGDPAALKEKAEKERKKAASMEQQAYELAQKAAQAAADARKTEEALAEAEGWQEAPQKKKRKPAKSKPPCQKESKKRAQEESTPCQKEKAATLAPSEKQKAKEASKKASAASGLTKASKPSAPMGLAPGTNEPIAPSGLTKASEPSAPSGLTKASEPSAPSGLTKAKKPHVPHGYPEAWPGKNQGVTKAETVPTWVVKQKEKEAPPTPHTPVDYDGTTTEEEGTKGSKEKGEEKKETLTKGPAPVLLRRPNMKLAVDWHGVLVIDNKYSPANNMWLQELFDRGYELYLISFCGKRRAKEVHDWAWWEWGGWESVSTCPDPLGKRGKAKWCQEHDMSMLIDDRSDICAEALGLGIEVFPVMQADTNRRKKGDPVFPQVFADFEAVAKELLRRVQ